MVELGTKAPVFTLLSDTELTWIQAYDAWKKKLNYSEVNMGAFQSIYLMAEDGVIVRAFGKVKAKENLTQMLAQL